MSYVKWFRFCALAAALFIGYIPAIYAATVPWLIQDMQFQDGTPVGGKFIYNEDTDMITWWNITTYNSGGLHPGTAYDSQEPRNKNSGIYISECCWHLDFYIGETEPSDYNHIFIFSFGQEHINGLRTTIDIWVAEGVKTGPNRYSFRGSPIPVTGTLAPIPVPSSLLLLGTGLIGLGWFKFRRRKK